MPPQYHSKHSRGENTKTRRILDLATWRGGNGGQGPSAPSGHQGTTSTEPAGLSVQNWTQTPAPEHKNQVPEAPSEHEGAASTESAMSSVQSQKQTASVEPNNGSASTLGLDPETPEFQPGTLLPSNSLVINYGSPSTSTLELDPTTPEFQSVTPPPSNSPVPDYGSPSSSTLELDPTTPEFQPGTLLPSNSPVPDYGSPSSSTLGLDPETPEFQPGQSSPEPEPATPNFNLPSPEYNLPRPDYTLSNPESSIWTPEFQPGAEPEADAAEIGAVEGSNDAQGHQPTDDSETAALSHLPSHRDCQYCDPPIEPDSDPAPLISGRDWGLRYTIPLPCGGYTIGSLEELPPDRPNEIPYGYIPPTPPGYQRAVTYTADGECRYRFLENGEDEGGEEDGDGKDDGAGPPREPLAADFPMEGPYTYIDGPPVAIDSSQYRTGEWGEWETREILQCGRCGHFAACLYPGARCLWCLKDRYR